MIPLASPLAQYRAHQSVIDAAIHRVLESGTYILGGEVERFERDIAAYCGVLHGIGVGNGTDALTLALKAFDIGSGDEVVTVSNSALATVAAIIAAGATPVLVDVDPVRRTMDPAKIERALTTRTKAVMPVHLYGAPADMGMIMTLARDHGVKVIEDCAQAVGARYRGKRVGGIGDAGCFSFYPTKNLGAIGDGGMVVTNDAHAAARLRRLRQYGWDDQRATNEAGVNSRLDPLQAAILAAKLQALDKDNARRRAIAGRYAEGLAGFPIKLPVVDNGSEAVFHLYVVECESPMALMEHLSKRGVGSAVHYPVPVHQQRGYAARVVWPAGGLPVTEHLAAHVLSLPIYPELTDDDVSRIIAATRSSFSGP